MMLIARAPVRISFGGGGTDLPAYYKYHDGLVVSSTIDYHIYTILTATSAEDVQIISADYRTLCEQPTCEDLIWDGDLHLPKAISDYFKVRGGVTIFLASQVPPGAGLGVSGSLAVSMIKALGLWCGLDLEPAEVAELACYIEIEEMGMPVGKQDQYAAAFGGLNVITFSRDGVTVEPLKLTAATRQALQERLMLFFTGVSRQSSTILRHQLEASQQGDREVLRRLGTIKALGLEIRDTLQQGNLDDFGELLHLSWLQKRRLAEGITNSFIDQCYDTARRQGAIGGKVTGAGGGGFLLLYCPKQSQAPVTDSLEQLGLLRCPLTLDSEGVRILQAMPWSRPYASHRAFLKQSDFWVK